MSLDLPARALAFALVFAAGCRPARERPEAAHPVITAEWLDAKGKGLAITQAEVRHELARLRFDREGSLTTGPITPQLREQVIERLIERRLLRLEAERLAVRASTAAVEREWAEMLETMPENQLRRKLVETFQTEADLRALIEERLTVGKLLSERAHGGVRVTEDEIKRAWDSMSEDERRAPARVHASQIVVPTEEEGNKVVKSILAGKDFAELARRHSVGPEAARGGDLGWFEAGVMPKVFDEVCFGLKPGDISTLTPSGYGFHIFKIHAAEPARPLAYEEERERLAAKILQDKLHAAEADYVRRLRGRARIVRDEAALATIE